MHNQGSDAPGPTHDARLEPYSETNPILSLTPQQYDDLRATLRLAVGSALAGGDAYLQRLRQLQTSQEWIDPETIVINEDETFRHQLKYLLLGLMFETPKVIQHGLMTVDQAARKGYQLSNRLLSPLWNSWLFRPVKNQVDRAARRGERVIDRIIMNGRIEEGNSRLMVQQKTLDDLVNDILEYVILKTEVMQIVQESGTGIAGGMIDEFREQSSAVDLTLEQKLRSIFKRRPPETTAPEESTPAGNEEV